MVVDPIFDFDELRNRLLQSDEFIINLVDTIPPKFYFNQEVQEKLTADKHAVMDAAMESLAHKRKFNRQQDLSAKNKHKRARLDPLQHKLVSQIQQEMDVEDSKPKKGSNFGSAALTKAANIEELEKRLQERIADLEAKRKSCPATDQSKERKRLEKKLAKMKKKKFKERGNMVKVTSEKVPVVKATKPKKVEQKPIFNKDGKMIYSKFDFISSGEGEEKPRQRPGKNIKKLMHVAKEEKEKVNKLKEEDPEKANNVIQKNAWKRALQKAEGVKLKDDPDILKKSMKRQEKKKKKSSQQWKTRVENTQKQMKVRQEKRSQNIRSKKKEKLDKKIKRAKKKGRIIPGF